MINLKSYLDNEVEMKFSKNFQEQVKYYRKNISLLLEKNNLSNFLSRKVFKTLTNDKLNFHRIRDNVIDKRASHSRKWKTSKKTQNKFVSLYFVILNR